MFFPVYDIKALLFLCLWHTSPPYYLFMTNEDPTLGI